MLITFNFGIQLLVDLLSAKFVDKIGYRVSIVMAHIFAALGLAGLVVLPDLLPNAFAGLLIAVVIYAIGGGLIEVLISPIMESCPSENKEKAMSLLHSSRKDIPVSPSSINGAIGTLQKRMPLQTGMMTHKRAKIFQFAMPKNQKKRVDRSTTPTCPQQ